MLGETLVTRQARLRQDAMMLPRLPGDRARKPRGSGDPTSNGSADDAGERRPIQLQRIQDRGSSRVRSSGRRAKRRRRLAPVKGAIVEVLWRMHRRDREEGLQRLVVREGSRNALLRSRLVEGGAALGEVYSRATPLQRYGAMIAFARRAVSGRAKRDADFRSSRWAWRKRARPSDLRR